MFVRPTAGWRYENRDYLIQVVNYMAEIFLKYLYLKYFMTRFIHLVPGYGPNLHHVKNNQMF